MFKFAKLSQNKDIVVVAKVKSMKIESHGPTCDCDRNNQMEGKLGLCRQREETEKKAQEEKKLQEKKAQEEKELKEKEAAIMTTQTNILNTKLLVENKIINNAILSTIEDVNNCISICDEATKIFDVDTELQKYLSDYKFIYNYDVYNHHHNQSEIIRYASYEFVASHINFDTAHDVNLTYVGRQTGYPAQQQTKNLDFTQIPVSQLSINIIKSKVRNDVMYIHLSDTPFFQEYNLAGFQSIMKLAIALRKWRDIFAPHALDRYRNSNNLAVCIDYNNWPLLQKLWLEYDAKSELIYHLVNDGIDNKNSRIGGSNFRSYSVVPSIINYFIITAPRNQIPVETFSFIIDHHVKRHITNSRQIKNRNEKGYSELNYNNFLNYYLTHVPSKYQSLPLIQHLLLEFNIDVSIRDHNNQDALILAIKSRSQESIIDLILSKQ
jgi:hypothetical protein